MSRITRHRVSQPDECLMWGSGYTQSPETLTVTRTFGTPDGSPKWEVRGAVVRRGAVRAETHYRLLYESHAEAMERGPSEFLALQSLIDEEK